MKTGRRVANPKTKQLAGTFRDDRHGDIITLATPARDEPTAPSYLTGGAKAVWDEEIRRVVQCGLTDADSSLFARYCSMEAAYREEIAEGFLPKAALLTELRRTAELLGIAGLRSRLARSSATETTKSPFAPRKSA